MENALYALIPEKRLSDILETFSACSDLATALLDTNGTPLLTYGSSIAYCDKAQRYIFPVNTCSTLHRKSAIRAQQLGESYIFSCHAGLNHIIYPLVYQGEMLGSVLAGPFVMDKPDSTLLSPLLEKYPIAASLALDLYDDLSEVPVISPKKVQNLSRLLRCLLESLLSSENISLMRAQESYHQQSIINETIQQYKGTDSSADLGFLRKKEKELLLSVRNGNEPEVKALLNDLLGYVLFHEGGKVNTIRIRVMELSTLLSRVAMDGGADEESIFHLNSHFLTLISQGRTTEELCSLLQNVAESFLTVMFTQIDKGNPTIRRALSYTASHYTEALTVAEVAKAVGLSANYFSRLFLATVGVPFHEHLNRLRIEKAKQLLQNTDDSLAQISVSLGFVDQSHFSRIFKQIVGLPPGKFRS